MQELPVTEATGLPYASGIRGVSHVCGHDMHVAWLVGAATLFAQQQPTWRGTLLTVFQPGEETAEGARAMIADGLIDRFPKPDVILAQHVMAAPAGRLGVPADIVTSAADTLQIRLFGRGAHGSMPQASIDPVIMAAAIVLRLQTIVSREIAATDSAVLTVGAVQAGTSANVIPDEAVIKLNVRTFADDVRRHVLAAIERIVHAEAAASGAPQQPEIALLDHYEMVRNDAVAAERVTRAFRDHCAQDSVQRVSATTASEDFGAFGAAWDTPSVYWFVGGTDPAVYAQAEAAGRLSELPTNHNPRFAPVLHPTLEAGIHALMVAARAWLAE